MQSQVRLSLRPNNQITLTKGSWKKPECDVSQKDRRNYAKKDVKKFLHQMAIDGIAMDEYENKKDLYEYRLRSAPLDIIQKSQRRQTPPQSKLNTPKSFTKASGQKLRECGAAIDIACNGDVSLCHEITLTLPANQEAAYFALAANSGYVINRLFQPLRRNYGDAVLWFFVWEYQKRGALHLHICIYHPDREIGAMIARELVEQWHKILCDLSERCNTDMFLSKRGDRCYIRKFHQHHTAPIRKAVGSYFSKYAGKQESKQYWYCEKYPVSRFWGCNTPIKAIIKSYSIQIDFDFEGRENEALAKFESIIENVIERLTIIATSEYSFNICICGAKRINRIENEKEFLSITAPRSISNGTRYTFYINQMELKKAIGLIEIESCFI